MATSTKGLNMTRHDILLGLKDQKDKAPGKALATAKHSIHIDLTEKQ
jgi:hypothetical protein